MQLEAIFKLDYFLIIKNIQMDKLKNFLLMKVLMIFALNGMIGIILM